MNLLYEDETYKIRKCVFNVYNILGPGHKESVYQNALAQEFRINEVSFEEQKSLSIYYSGKKVGDYRPDFIVNGKIIIEIKASELTIKNYEKQLLYYLKGTNFELGLLVNFGSQPVLIKRVIWTPQSSSEIR